MMVDLSRIKTPASTVLHSIYPAIHTICVYHILLAFAHILYQHAVEAMQKHGL